MAFDTEGWGPVLQCAQAIATALGCLLGVLLSISLGWYSLWCLVLHRIGFFRDILGLNRAKNEEARRRAQVEIKRLKQHMGRPKTQ